MATLAFQQYTYVATPPRSKSTTTRRKPTPEQVSMLHKLQHIRLSGASLSTARPAAAVAAASNNRSDKPGIRGIRTLSRGSDKGNEDENQNNNNNDDDVRDLPTIEELLRTRLQEQGFAAAEPSPGHGQQGVEEAAAKERGGSIDQCRSAQNDKSFGSLEDPIVLLGGDDSSAAEAEVDNGNRAESTEPDAGLFGPPSTHGWYDIDDFPDRAPRLRLAEQEPSVPNSTRHHTPSSRLSSEALHDGVSTEGSRCSSSDATTSSSSPPRRLCSPSPETQPSREGHPYIGRGIVDKHGLVGPALDISSLNDGAMVQQQEVELAKDEGNDEDEGEDEISQQEGNDLAVAVTAEKVVSTHISGREDGSPRSAVRQQMLPNRDPSSEPCQDGAGRDNHSDGKLNNTDSDDDDEEPRLMKRRRSSLSRDGSTRKKRKHCLQQRSTHQHRSHSKPHGRSPNSPSPLNQASKVAVVSSNEGPLPSPASSARHATDIDISPDCYNLDRSSGAALPTLTEVTFRPHSALCCSFTAVIRDGCEGRGVSFSQLLRLIASIGHMGKIEDFIIKSVEEHSYLVTGVSRHTSSRPSFGSTTLSTTAEIGRDHVDVEHIQSQDGSALVSRRSKQSSSDNDQFSSTRTKIPWGAIDEQRLRAYKKEGKPWDWIFKKFPGRTPAAVRTRWTIVQRKVE